MGPQVLLIPALFVVICATFILLHSCYHKWRMSTILKKKRDAAKISLVNILQMTNATLIHPPWSNKNGAVKSNIRPQVLVNDVTLVEDKEKSSEKSGLPSPTFDPRNPHVLSSVLICPPPCYEDLYGNAGAVFTFKSLTPERDEPPSISSTQSKQNDDKCGEGVNPTNPNSRAQYQYYSNNGNHTCLLQVPPQDTTAVPNQERRNSSAVLYL